MWTGLRRVFARERGNGQASKGSCQGLAGRLAGLVGIHEHTNKWWTRPRNTPKKHAHETQEVCVILNMLRSGKTAKLLRSSSRKKSWRTAWTAGSRANALVEDQRKGDSQEGRFQTFTTWAGWFVRVEARLVAKASVHYLPTRASPYPPPLRSHRVSVRVYTSVSCQRSCSMGKLSKDKRDIFYRRAKEVGFRAR